tara:strand:- start:3627 stop:3782 length:156 start_codon:yes stop_codon:yes gene_type:complete
LLTGALLTGAGAGVVCGGLGGNSPRGCMGSQLQLVPLALHRTCSAATALIG